ncbi:hypothetical protein E3V38_02725 [Streptococcus pseudopneumoniae]|nr:hypothetical protein [Streptococcus pseudopneumoniae]NIB78313.1 hypothetical protein [Streptococcus pseudopneumoniae]NIB82490.1 hypothetical protein [Streptococcus pseudopneumoniae]NIB88471.1 hypothetical protein [Streptococcus pseudopneumoniae]NIB96209.1 hypothetical protein [Streptococcus pseudopneumoniae]
MTEFCENSYHSKSLFQSRKEKNESDDSLFLKSRNNFPEVIIQSFADWSLHRDSSRLGHTPARLND